MKRKFLPFSLTLITIVLGVLVLSFTISDKDARYEPRNAGEASLVYGIKPAEAYLTQIRNNQVTGVISPEDIAKVQKQLEKFSSDKSYAAINWSQVGPDNFGGRTRAIIFDNTDSEAKTVFAAGVTGGIWKSDNVGTTWNKVNVSGGNLYVTSMKQAANGKIYVGTGESFVAETMSGISEFGISGFMGTGMFVSSDGDNFTLLEATKPAYNDNESSWAYINEIGIDMSSGAILAATNSGLMYSNDEGSSWSVAMDTAGNELSMNAMDVQVSLDGAIIACVEGACYISPNGDFNAFMNRSTGDSISLPDENAGRIEFAFSESDPSIVYASIADDSGDLLGIYLSEDKGVNWRVILPESPAVNIFDGQGIYDNAITVFPNNPYSIIVGGVNAWEGVKVQETGLYSWNSISSSIFNPFSPYYLHVDHHVYVFQPGSNNTFLIGTDGGVAFGVAETDEYVFQQSNRNYYTTQFYSIGISGDKKYVTGGAQDNGTILITGTGNTERQGEEIFAGDGVGTVISVINKDVLVVSEPANENDYIFRSEDGGVNYSNQFIGPITSFLGTNSFYTPLVLWESFNNPNSRDSVMYHAKETITGGTTFQVQSNNSGQPFNYTLPAGMTLNAGDSMAIQDIVSSKFFVAGFNKVYMTLELHDFTKTPEWFEISNTTVGYSGSTQCLGYSHDANHLWAGTKDGKLYRISNLALAYNYDRADVNSPECIVSTQEIELPITGQVITSVSVDPNNPQHVMVTLGNYGNDQYVLYSQNALDEFPVFESRQGNLPAMPVYASLFEMTNTNMVIIGTEYGIFLTEDITVANPVWVQEVETMGAVPVFQLKQQTESKTSDTVILVNGNEVIEVIYPGTNNYGVVYAATFGRGLLLSTKYQKPVGIDEDNEITKTIVQNIKVYPNPVSEMATFEFEAENNSIAEIGIYDIAGRLAYSQSNTVKSGSNKLHLDLSELQTGSYVVQMVIGKNLYSSKIIVK